MMPLRHVLSSLLLLGCALPAANAWAGPWFVSPERARALITAGACLLDARSAAAYAKGHLRGAVHAPWQRFSKRHPASARGELAPLPKLRRSLRAAGIKERGQVLVVGDPRHGWGEEGRIAWMLRALGHRRTAIVDGGYEALRKIGLPETREVTAPSRGDFTPRAPRALSIDTAGVAKRMREGGVLFVDTREGREYRGATPYGETRGGRLPGAVHLHYRSLLRPDGRLLSSSALRARLLRVGLRKDRPLIAYCTGGVRSAFVVAVLAHLGYGKIENYAGSMWAWAAAERAKHPLVK